MQFNAVLAIGNIGAKAFSDVNYFLFDNHGHLLPLLSVWCVVCQ